MRIRQAPQSHLRSRTLGVSQECVGHVWNRLDRLPVFSDTPCAHTSFEYGGDPLLDNAQGEGRKHSFPCFHYRRMGNGKSLLKIERETNKQGRVNFERGKCRY